MEKIFIKSIIEKNEKIIIEFETKYGKDTFRTKADRKYLHLETGRPQWLHELKEYLDKKYKDIDLKEKSSKEFNEYIEKEIDMTEIEDISAKTKMDFLEELREKNKIMKEKRNQQIEQHNKEILELDKERNRLYIKLKQLKSDIKSLEHSCSECEKTTK